MTSLLAVASSPTTPSQRLMSMIGHPDQQIRKALANNANLPLRGLFRLMNEFPTQVLTNASVALMRVEDPWLFEKAPLDCKVKWASNPEMPGWLLEQLAKDSDERILIHLVTNPSTPIGVLTRLALPQEFSDPDEDEDDDWTTPRFEVLENPALPDALRFDVECSLCDDGGDLEYCGLSPELMEYAQSLRDEQTFLLPEPEPEELWGVLLPEGEDEFPLLWRAENGVHVEPYEAEGVCWGFEEAPEGVGGDWPGEDVRTLWGSTILELVLNKATPLHLLRRWLRHPECSVRVALAAHPALGAEELVELAQDREFAVRLVVAANPGIPAAALEWLARDESGKIRAAVVSNPRCPNELREVLLDDERPLVRRAASRHTHHEQHSNPSF